MAVDDWHVGVRVSRPELGPVIESMFAGHLVDHADDPDVPPNWSLRIGGFGDEDDDGQQALQLLYLAKRQAARSRWPSHILHALAAQVSAVSDRPLPGWRNHGVVLVGPSGAAVLATPEVRALLPKLSGQLEARQVAVSSATDPRVDLEAGEVLVPQPLFAVPPALAADLDRRFGPTDRDQPLVVAPGTYRLAGWASTAGAGSTAATVAALVESFTPPGAAERRVLLEAVATDVGRRHVLALRGADHSANVDALCELVR